MVAAVESLPEELDGAADRITINLPWGSLLRGVVDGSEHVLGRIASAASKGAEVRLLFSIEERDMAATKTRLPSATHLAARWAERGFEVVDLRPAEPAEIDATGSSWAKRLRAGADRDIVLLRALKR